MCLSQAEVTDGLVVIVGVSVIWNVLSWSGGHEFKPQPGWTWGAWYFCPKWCLNQTYLDLLLFYSCSTRKGTVTKHKQFLSNQNYSLHFASRMSIRKINLTQKACYIIRLASGSHIYPKAVQIAIALCMLVDTWYGSKTMLSISLFERLS